jgi:hypothetical protein
VSTVAIVSIKPMAYETDKDRKTVASAEQQHEVIRLVIPAGK